MAAGNNDRRHSIAHVAGPAGPAGECLKPFDAQLQKNALQYKATLAAAPPLAENQFIEEKYDDYNLPQFMFQQSCAFCHGGVGNGQGIEAGNLKIAPADLTQVCTRPHSLMALLRTGIPGTAMPYFSVYTDDALRGLIRYLYQNVGVSKLPAPVVPEIPSEEEQVAATVFAEQCASCHGADGKISAKGKALLPAPLSMREWALQPAASYNVITNGYPGTAMKGFAHLPEQVRRALVKYVNDLYNGRHR
jgi:mono/diheme cytochrome c family protein